MKDILHECNEDPDGWICIWCFARVPEEACALVNAGLAAVAEVPGAGVFFPHAGGPGVKCDSKAVQNVREQAEAVSSLEVEVDTSAKEGKRSPSGLSDFEKAATRNQFNMFLQMKEMCRPKDL
jgi:hypothetical protein